jgi:thymidylate synthase ThyX
MSGSIKLSVEMEYCIVHFDDNLSVSYSYQNGEAAVANTIKRKKEQFAEKIREAYKESKELINLIQTNGINLVTIFNSENNSRKIKISHEDLKIKSYRTIIVEMNVIGECNTKILQEGLRPFITKLAGL